MIKPRINLIGKVFGYLTIIEHIECRYTKSGKAVARVKCKCVCGNICVKDTQTVKTHKNVNCGCKTNYLHSLQGTHHKSKSRIYHVWLGIKSRCYNIKNNRYKNYGGRGITMCDEWKDNFQAFYKWAVDNGYKDNLTIDRIDVNGNYEPNNCRFITNKEQARNKTTTVEVYYDNKNWCLKELCIKKNLPYKTIWQRIKVLNWNIDKALNTPVRKLKR